MGLVSNFTDEPLTIDGPLAVALQGIVAFIDPKKQLVIKTDAGERGGLNMYTTTKEATIGDDLDGYALIDIKTALAVAIRDDLTGFVLQALQQKWERDLTIEDAENITFYLHKLIHLLT